MDVLVWSDDHGPQAAWVIPQSADPDVPMPEAAWSPGAPKEAASAVVAAKGNQSWRMWAAHLAANPALAGGAFSVSRLPDTFLSLDALSALRLVQYNAIAMAAGA
jgi:hypothetical protein